jgi:PAS domain-containing protein
MSAQKPLEIILARNLLSSISTPAFLIGAGGALLFYNEAAGTLIGRRFEEMGVMEAAEWTSLFGPLDEDGQPIPYEEIPLVKMVREGRPSHGRFRIPQVGGDHRDIAASSIPIVGPGGSTGAIVVFWTLTDEERGESG